MSPDLGWSLAAQAVVGRPSSLHECWELSSGPHAWQAELSPLSCLPAPLQHRRMGLREAQGQVGLGGLSCEAGGGRGGSVGWSPQPLPVALLWRSSPSPSASPSRDAHAGSTVKSVRGEDAQAVFTSRHSCWWSQGHSAPHTQLRG